ncbi:Bcl2-associated agonist of cell death [Bagarius yarrelli]|uniref:Bcl2-associated agonist of cell death n=1 Tax=Bagarius yarrelli TaxID=175774 RepID=A0A556TX94_BAGYA|nr:Bcl2-associated agonist of cell death [Bagarius yarrelli]
MRSSTLPQKTGAQKTLVEDTTIGSRFRQSEDNQFGLEVRHRILLSHFDPLIHFTDFTMDETADGGPEDVSPLDDNEAREEWSEKMRNTNPADETSLRVGGRVRLYSESQVHTVSRWEDAELQDGISAEESGGSTDGAPFRGRSQSAPAALWKAKKYGRQLRRMSDEFDTWLDRGDVRRVSGAGKASQKQPSRGWFSFIWGTKEEEGRE